MHQQRWHPVYRGCHRRYFFSFLLSFFYLITCTPPIHSSSLSVHQNPFRSSSPPFFISCQMIFESGLIRRPTAFSIAVSLALFLIVCLFYVRVHKWVPFLLPLSFSFVPVLLSLCKSLRVHLLLTFLSPFCSLTASFSPILAHCSSTVSLTFHSLTLHFSVRHPLYPPYFHLTFSITPLNFAKTKAICLLNIAGHKHTKPSRVYLTKIPIPQHN